MISGPLAPDPPVDGRCQRAGWALEAAAACRIPALESLTDPAAGDVVQSRP
jgi:hypothetical protein